jgi:hypothetical protein
MDGDLTRIPTFVTSIPQDFFIEPLNSPSAPAYHLDNFPDSLYNKAPDSVLVKLLFTLLGPLGMGLVQDGYVKARLALEDSGIEGFDLDSFYGDPFKFARVLDESYDDAGDLAWIPAHGSTQAGWEEIKAKDTKYRNRAISFIKGAHMGGTINGLSLVAKSGFDKNAELVERYKVFFDRHSEIPLDLEDIGSTRSLSELVVRPLLTDDEYAVGTDQNQFEYDRHSADSALSRIKPADVFITITPGSAAGRVHHWTRSYSSSDFAQASLFVTGKSSIPWPKPDDIHWIKPNEEIQAPETKTAHNYEFFHSVKDITASSTQVGRFPSEQSGLFPLLSTFTDGEVFDPRRVLANQSSMARGTDVITGMNSSRPNGLFNYVYPDTYLGLIEGSPSDNAFWSAQPGEPDSYEYLEIDLGEAKAVNFVSFETLNLPVKFDIQFDNLDPQVLEYDNLGHTSNTSFATATKIGPISSLKLDPQRSSVWEHVTFDLSDGSDNTIFTRFIRVRFHRLFSALQDPWAIPVRGLRIGRVS